LETGPSADRSCSTGSALRADPAEANNTRDGTSSPLRALAVWVATKKDGSEAASVMRPIALIAPPTPVPYSWRRRIRSAIAQAIAESRDSYMSAR